MNTRKHWESKSRNLYDSRENHHKVEILNYSEYLQYRKRNRDFITINFQNLAFFQGVFHVLERYITGGPSSRLEKKTLSFDMDNSDGKASLKRQKSPETTTDTQGMSKFYWFYA